MRKKILSGMLMVAAMLFATSVFTSCKDTYTDDIAQVKGDLQTEIINLRNDLQGQIDALRVAQETCKQNCEATQKNLQNQIDELRKAMETVVPDAEIKALETQVKALSDEVAALKAQDAFLEAKIKELQDTLNGVDLSQIEKNKNDIAALSDKVNALILISGDVERVVEILSGLESKIQEAADNAKKAADDAKKAADDAQKASDDAQAAQATAQAAQAAAQAAQAAALAAQATADKGANDIEALSDKIVVLEGKIGTLESDVTTLKSDVTKAKDQADAALALAQANAQAIQDLQAAIQSIPAYNGYTKDEVDQMVQDLNSKLAENKMAVEDAAKVADDAYELAKKAYNLADDAKTIALQALNNAAVNAQDIRTLDEFTKALEEAYKAADEALQNQIDDIVNVELPAIKSDIASLQERMGIVEQDIADLSQQHQKDVEALKKQITGIIVQGAYSPAFGQLSLPAGVNTTMLCALYGNYTEADTEWPADVIDLTNISKAKTLSLENGQDLVSDGNKAYAGKLYLTVNPAEANFTGVDFTLETSAGNQSVFELGKLKKSTDELTFGWTRAGVPNFYESKAYVKIADIEDAKITKNINLDEIQAAAKSLLNGLKGGSANLAGVMNTLVSNFNGILPAYAAKVSVEDPTLGTTTIVSNYNIAATAWKPLSFEFLKGKTFTLPHVSPLDVTFDMHLQDPAYPENINADFWVVIDNSSYFRGTIYGLFETKAQADAFNATTMSGTCEVVKISKLTDQLIAAITVAVNDVKDLEDNIAQQASDNFDNAIDKINSQIISRVNNLINKFGSKFTNLNQYLLPTVLYQAQNGWAIASTVPGLPTPAAKGIVELNATTYTNEIFAPAYKKFVAVTSAPSQKAMDAANNSLYKMAKVIDGNVKQVYCQFTEPGVYEVSFAALDYSGKTVVAKHYFEVKE